MSSPKSKAPKPPKLPKTVAAVKKAAETVQEATPETPAPAQEPKFYSFKNAQNEVFLVVTEAGVSIGGAPIIGVGPAVFEVIDSLVKGQDASYKKGYRDGAGDAFVKLQTPS